MAHSDYDEEQEPFEDVEEENEEDIEEENLEAAEDATEEGDGDSPSEDSEDGSEDAEDDDSEPAIDITGDLLNEAFAQVEASAAAAENTGSSSRSSEPDEPIKQEHGEDLSPAPPLRLRNRPISPSGARKKALRLAKVPRGLVVEAVCAIPHPVPTNALAASHCMTHLLTGSEDGYIRDYDIFAALNSKNFLSAPQRHHTGVVEGLMKAGQHRFWWENNLSSTFPGIDEDRTLVPVHSLAMHSDALWALAGTNFGPINLFTVRHEPGRLCHTFVGHRDLVSSLSLNHDEKSLFSASWDGEAIQWDLNTGQKSRTFTSHGAQLTCIAVRPENAVYTDTGSPIMLRYEDESPPNMQAVDPSATMNGSSHVDLDTKSDASFDPLFDDEPEDGQKPLVNGVTSQAAHTAAKPSLSTIAPPKGAPPLLDSQRYKTFSPDILMTAAIDGQIMLWDKRANTVGQGVGRLWISEKTPPWCLSACWSADGNQIYAGRRNGTVEIYDVRQSGRATPDGPRLLKTLRNPSRSGVVSCVVGFPDNKHIACASIDNIRLWNADAIDSDAVRTKGGTQFKVIPGHHGGFISQMLVDSGSRFLVSASSNRSNRESQGDSTRTVFVHDIQHVQ
ncbi:WD40-repeat-containing domain protein [Lentinula boryana]|uniref:WD40-repeat-containing domain protein n=1 Tax=Lentinula boryana TaxID=40481 RepID=A0ABQ8QKY4_9AGAR|nr:WD40-repeat-containing domain protein [Lentinula boryana]